MAIWARHRREFRYTMAAAGSCDGTGWRRNFETAKQANPLWLWRVDDRIGKGSETAKPLLTSPCPRPYAGSEVTPILGETSGGEKTTIRRDHSLMPDIVIYDPDLTTSLPVSMSIVSGINAIAHAAEGFTQRTAIPSAPSRLSKAYERFAPPCPS